MKRVSILQSLIDKAGAFAKANSASDDRGRAVPSPAEMAGQIPPIPSPHPQVDNILRFIEKHLADPTMNVGKIAEAMQLNPAYLSHLFAGQTGVRMGRYIAARRIELAKRLLATTDWQVKRIAFESGHGNADWFSQVFHAHEGMTPGDYRRRARGR